MFTMFTLNKTMFCYTLSQQKSVTYGKHKALILKRIKINSHLKKSYQQYGKSNVQDARMQERQKRTSLRNCHF